jgi:hypothetical protein
MKFEGLLTNPLPVLPRKIEYSEFLFSGPRDKQQHLNLVIIGQGRIPKIWKKFKRQIFFSFFQIRKGALLLKIDILAYLSNCVHDIRKRREEMVGQIPI